MKLQAAGLDPESFPISAYAEDGAKRSDLVRAAMRRLDSFLAAQAHDGRTAGSITTGRVIIVGDTPRDIACAAESGCRVLAVATGYYSVGELRECAPDRVVADLTDATPLTDLITLASRG
jgi:phosphoglycolate phosphatase-like HAD superfamily hydrolase